jgi:hypothetical protein
MNGLLRDQHLDENGSSIYTGVILSAPFFLLPNFEGVRSKRWLLSLLVMARGDNAMCPEIHVEPDQMEEYQYHFAWDKYNRYQRKCPPAKTVINFIDEISYLESLITKN